MAVNLGFLDQQLRKYVGLTITIYNLHLPPIAKYVYHYRSVSLSAVFIGTGNELTVIWITVAVPVR
jgi:hypothetical protein